MLSTVGVSTGSSQPDQSTKGINNAPDAAQTGKDHANEHAFIKETHYEPQAKKLSKDLGLDVAKRSAALRDVVWSTAVHHGPNTDAITTAVKPLVEKKKLDDVTDEEIIGAVYAERGRKNPDGSLARFKGVSPDWIPGLTKRFENEMKDALEMLKK